MALRTNIISSVLLLIIFLIIIFQVLADTAGDINTAAGNITSQSAVYPLTNFFSAGGVILLALMAGVVIVLITAALNLGGRK